jgi:hypothetical protein
VKSLHEQLKDLEQSREALIKEAKTSALQRAETAIRELNDIGFHYVLREGATKAKAERKGQSDAPKRKSRDEPCKICGFKTSPIHDARAHRGQAHKKPFTPAELSAKGLHKVGD